MADKMLKRIEPSKIICFGNPFVEMQRDIIFVGYNTFIL